MPTQQSLHQGETKVVKIITKSDSEVERGLRMNEICSARKVEIRKAEFLAVDETLKAIF